MKANPVSTTEQIRRYLVGLRMPRAFGGAGCNVKALRTG